MNAKQNNQFRMQLAVQACMDQNTEKWNNVPVIAQIKNQLDETEHD